MALFRIRNQLLECATEMSLTAKQMILIASVVHALWSACMFAACAVGMGMDQLGKANDNCESVISK